MRARKHTTGLTVVLGLMLTHAALAQAPDADKSYVEIRPPSDSIDPANVLRQRLERLQGMSETQKLIEKLLSDPRGQALLRKAGELGVTPGLIERWRQRYERDGFQGVPLGDPRLQGMVKKLLKQPQADGPFGLSEEQRKRINETIRNWPTEPPAGLPDDEPDPRPLSPPPPSDAPTPPGKKTMPPMPSGKMPPMPPAPESTEPTLPDSKTEMSEGFADWLRQQSERLGRTDWVLHRSPALQRAMDHLDRYLAGETSGRAFDILNEPWTDRFGHMLEQARTQPFWTQARLPQLPHISLPSLPRPNLPHVHLPSVHLPRFGTPSLGWLGQSGGASKSVLWLLLVALLGTLAWRLRGVVKPRDSSGFAPPQLGAWPVPPDAVATWEHLVQAFEYLAVLRLGGESRSWNHHQIAAGLSGDNATQRDAALRLAELYEQARYVPSRAPLSPEGMLVARRALTYLAGVRDA